MGRNKTKGGRILNPTDAYRKAMRKRELKKVKNTSLEINFNLCLKPILSKKGNIHYLLLYVCITHYCILCMYMYMYMYISNLCCILIEQEKPSSDERENFAAKRPGSVETTDRRVN
jgi:hypothetical protein